MYNHDNDPDDPKRTILDELMCSSTNGTIRLSSEKYFIRMPNQPDYQPITDLIRCDAMPFDWVIVILENEIWFREKSLYATFPKAAYVERRHFARQNDVRMSKLLVWFSVGLRRRRRIFSWTLIFGCYQAKLSLSERTPSMA